MLHYFNRMKIGFDLDGIFVDKPPVVPRSFLDWLYRGTQHNGPTYRFPKTRLERAVRHWSHIYYFRPAIKKNIDFVHHFSLHPHHQFYLVTSRYDFLEKATYKLLNRYQLITPFQSININKENDQPHLYKEKMIKKLKLDLLVDDDLKLLKYLSEKYPKVTLLWYNPQQKANTNLAPNLQAINNLETIKKYLV